MKKIIIDTDLGSDCDDVAALALANIYETAGRCEVLGVTYTTSLPWGPIAIDAVNCYYGHKYRIGKTKRTNFLGNESTSKYAKELATTFANNGIQVEDAVTLTRTLLQAQDAKEVTLIYIGQLNNLSDLLDSNADEISDLNGVELVKQKVLLIKNG